MEGGRGWRKRGGRVCTELNPSCVALLDKPSSYGSRQAPGDRNSDIWSVSSRRIHGKNSISPAQQDPTTSKFLLKQHHKGAWRVATFDLFRTADPQSSRCGVLHYVVRTVSEQEAGFGVFRVCVCILSLRSIRHLLHARGALYPQNGALLCFIK